ncbi:SusC/RagA family TonB-linked outer membrane protein [Ferruginibacter sp.]|uniref:SusC/RagA family TonB-linked outer membrane protein n=1 Tax=Ferruginibacter sp. TaxID=1940288 RepID=UPI00265B3C58|nr:SusC/RagA family TonB-linked outer membrane protein [Ferruginibacter sp.]
MKKTIILLRRIFFKKINVPPFTWHSSIASLLTEKLLQCCIVCLLLFMGQRSTAQVGSTTDVTGIVLSEKGEALPGATVMARNLTTKATAYSVTDENGVFLFRKLSIGTQYDYSFTFLGYYPETINGFVVKQGMPRSTLSVKLKERNALLGQVVVTALGIVQKKASLGYATQEVKGSTLNEARDNNFVNGLSGRVAGVNIISGNGVGSSARITIRGESSLNYFKNQPLVVVDGVPVSNDPVINSGGGTSPDYGSSLNEINPADIESVNVLKGAAASALYGSRAANGALVITTKSGKGNKGMGVSLTSGYTWENPLMLPKFQNSFGGGTDGNFEGSNFGQGGTPYPNGVNEDWDESWGPALNGQLITQFDGPTKNGFRGGDVNLPNRGDIIATPYIAHPNNMKDFFVTGHSRYNSVALSGNNEIANYRFSYTNNAETGIVPNNNLTRNSFNLKTGFKLSNRLTADAVVTYSNTNSSSRPNLGYDHGTPMYEFVWFNRNVDINSLRNYWQPGLQGIQQFSQDYGNGHDNPFFYAYENTSAQIKNQLYGNVKLTYKILDNLTVTARAGTDYFSDFRPSRIALSSSNALQGSYAETQLGYQENNYDVLASYRKNIKDFHLNFSAGANSMERFRSQRNSSAGALVIPGVYSLNNSNVPVQVSAGDEHRKTNSVYAFAQGDYQGKVFIGITGRNDWSSTLPASNNSYFYPSVNSSILFDKIFKMSDKIDLLKLRLAYAQAGNDAEPYSILTSYNYQQLWNGLPSLSESSTLNNSNLKPEKSSTAEIGAELSLFKGRLGLDVTAYSTTSKNQILSLTAPVSSGYRGRVINAGEISNKGFEIQLNAVPIRSASGFTWNMMINFARNISKVVSLAPGVDNIVQAAPGEDATIEARVGQRMGSLYGPGFQRVPDGPLKGMPIIGSNGRPKITPTSIYLGNINPDWTAGITNRIAYKGVYLEFLFDMNYGGVMVSRFINKATGAGQLIETAEARLKHAPDDVYNTDYYRDGGVLQTDGSYLRNLQIFDGSYSKGLNGTGPRNFYKRYYDHNSEAQLVNRTFVKLRETKIGYNFPKKMYGHLPIQNINFSLVGRNLLLFTKNNQFDPETAASSGQGLVGGFENLSLPTTRSFGVNLSIVF